MNNHITDLYKESFIKAVIDANTELYNYIHFYLKKEDLEYSNTIGHGGDNSLNIDLYAEEIFIKHLKEFGNIYSEECGFLDFNSDFEIIIDPIDGSDNFLSNLQYYGSSIALKKNNQTIAGFVCNLATSLMIYSAFGSSTKYLFLSNKKVFYPTSTKKFAIFERAYKYPNICHNLENNKIKFRSLGAAAISLAFSRNYNFVMFIGEIREFDIAAALYICRDLFIYKRDNILVISENKQKIELIKEIIKNNRL